MEENMVKCSWCGDEYDFTEIRNTDLGDMCDRCIEAIKSHGEDIAVYY